MAVVCQDSKSAQTLRDYTDKAHTSIKEGKSRLSYLAEPNREDVTVLGILTLENVIERVLLTEIHDEKDRDKQNRGLSYLTKNDMLSQISD